MIKKQLLQSVARAVEAYMVDLYFFSSKSN